MTRLTTLWLLCFAGVTSLSQATDLATKNTSNTASRTSSQSNDSTDNNVGTAVAADDDTAADVGTGAKLSVAINGVEDEALLENIHAFLELDDLAKDPIKNPSYTRYMIDVGAEQIKQALHPFGYYLTQVEPTLDESPDTWSVKYDIQLGEPVIIKSIDVKIHGAGENDSDFQTLLNNYPLHVGEVLLQEKYTTFKNDVLALATTNGYFDASFKRTQILLSEDLKHADIHVVYDTGERYQFGKTTFKQDILDEDVFQRFVTYAEGEVYRSDGISDTQRDIYNAGYVKAIDVTADPDKKNKHVPVEFALTPQKNKRHRFAVGYGTDTGARAKYDFDWRWVNRRGHRFKSSIFLSQKLIESGLEYHIPAKKPATDHYKFFANFRQDKGGDKESTLWNVGAGYRDQKGHLTREIGIKWQQEDFTVGNDSGNVGLLTPYAKLTYRKVDDPLNVKRGLLLSTALTGASDSLLSDVSFVQATADAKYIRRLDDAHKLTLHGAVGRTYVSDFHQLPSAYRFFTGGDRTVRGYRFDKIGDVDSSGSVIGGDKLYRMGAEYEYFFKENMAAAVFVDAGDAYSADSASLKVGAGLGFHYYSPIGPIKVDVAHGFHEPGDDVRLHLSIGPEM